ncbi:hypothetical protein ACH5RR_038345 [Cinchona calisaya]|uniref:NAB domain-containing protein n=1 Tax=Cinchona calisaya TaxID=153742 RepID=A0ABD2XYB0_9GENT
MTKHWKDSIKSFRGHINHETEERLKWIKIGKYYSPEQPHSLQYYRRLWDSCIGNKTVQFKAHLPAQCYPHRGLLWFTELQRLHKTENKVKRSLKLIKSINQNKEGNLKKKMELTHLIEDIQKEYQSIYALYDNLRGEVRVKVHGKDESASDSDSSSSNSNSDTEYYTPEELNGRNTVPNAKHQKVNESDNKKSENSDSEDAMLKDILTSTSEIKESPSVDSLETLTEVPESSVIFKDLTIQEEQSESMKQKLLDECAQLKERLNKKEEETLFITKKHQAFRDQKLSEIKELEVQVTSLKLELETVTLQKKAFEENVQTVSNDAKQMRKENSQLQVQISDLEALLKEKENQFSSLLENFDEDKKHSLSKLEDLMTRASNLQLEVDTLCSEKCILEEQLARESKERSIKVNSLKEKVKSLQQRLEFVSRQKSEVESQLKNKSQEVSECLVQMEELRGKLTGKELREQEITEDKVRLKVKVEELEQEISTLSSQKSELEDQIISTKSEAHRLKIENENLYRRISVLETTLKERENELSALEKKFQAQENEMSTQIRSLTAQINNFQQKLETVRNAKNGLQMQLEQEKQVSCQSLTHMERKNIELTNKIADQQKTLTLQEDVINKLNEEYKQVQSRLVGSKSNFQIAERKMEEMAEEFFKKCEDNLRILSRRIRVAEQLHVENKEWYGKTKDRYEQQNKELKERVEKNEIWLSNIKDMTLTADNTLSDLDAVALKFEGSTANFLNRISKVSCELKFAKDWIKRKNKAMVHVKDDLECLLAQLDDKEAEILVFREKVWKSENKARELEKLIKENEEAMLVLKEEKREAIRQLCVWIDYHRSHSDYYKKMLSDITTGSRKTT